MTSPENKLIETNPPMGVTLSMVWSFYWRSFLWSIAFMLVLMIVVVTLAFVTGAVNSLDQMAKGPPVIFEIVIWFFMLAGWIWICQKVFRQMLGKKFGGYRLVFLTPQAVASADEAVSKAADSALAPPPV